MPATETSPAAASPEPLKAPSHTPVLLAESELVPLPFRSRGAQPFNAQPSRVKIYRVVEVPVTRATSRPPRVNTGKKPRASPYERPASTKKVSVQWASAPPSNSRQPLPDSSGSAPPAGDDNNLNGPTLELIPKPLGEAGRPGRCGYNLGTSLRAIGWPGEDVDRLKSSVGLAVERHLDITMCYMKQLPAALKRACEDATYEKMWPIEDVIKARLKYTSCRARLIDRQKKT
ncbi:uncharacterized protein PHACADRAFT_207580 [Phanerochaete carnosa HHB-10118-sp]|uniref:Uncharacterized protein n=1 Tax=Phanerochaete carnosa (strain HHB-10118-sp) TaxID=650164 RepID=K5VXM7_PHACS|nr:uncharacterized protein PHACADRAFT_207580 [Phanerochaete carnosa HHB-10118-sp]EKM56303.1 hypothetical protein PHACADRAFT_207580 [Phanerochaete carnosa HHB-10118-sp]